MHSNLNSKVYTSRPKVWGAHESIPRNWKHSVWRRHFSIYSMICPSCDTVAKNNHKRSWIYSSDLLLWDRPVGSIAFCSAIHWGVADTPWMAKAVKREKNNLRPWTCLKYQKMMGKHLNIINVLTHRILVIHCCSFLWLKNSFFSAILHWSLYSTFPLSPI
jgi:hypothetical protein